MIMKKIYKSPEMKVVKISTVTMIAASKPVDLGDAEDYEGGGELSGARRRRSEWDDEEFEDEEDF